MELRDKVVVITGSGRGIGEACAHRFTAEGAKVVVTDIDADGVERVVSSIGSVGLATDITVERNVQSVAQLARETHGEIDLWFSNAGISGPRQPGELQDDSMWDTLWRLHVMAHHPIYQMALTPDRVADWLVRAVGEERFLVVDSDSGRNSLVSKAADYDRWIDDVGSGFAAMIAGDPES